jgi:hypothetical protein
MPEYDACPGCRQPLNWWPGHCWNCHYFDLLTGRAHYCGRADCYCRGLRRELPVSLLNTFIPTGDEGDPGFIYGIEYPTIEGGRGIQAPLTKPFAVQMASQGPARVVVRRPVDMSDGWEQTPDV